MAVVSDMTVHKINSTIPKNRQHVQFRNGEGFIITYAKAASDAKNFREAAALLGSVPGARPKAVAKWLNDLAGQYGEA